MKKDLQKIIKELNDYFDKSGIRGGAGIHTLAYVSDGSKNGNNNSPGCAFKVNIAADPCASYADYDDIKDELNYLIDKKAVNQSLFDLVEKHLKEKGMKPSTVYKNAQISKQDFSRYVKPNAETISRTMVFNLAIGLKLDVDETKALLKSAGYGLNSKSKFDIIVMFCIKRKLYNVTFINMLLDEFRQPLLKSQCSKEN